MTDSPSLKKSLWFAVAALLLIIIPMLLGRFIGSGSRIILAIVYFLPTIAAILGIIAIVVAIHTLRRIKVESLPVKRNWIIWSLVLGGLTTLVGLFWIMGVVTLFYTKWPDENHPVGSWEIYHYGSIDSDERGYRSVVLPDSNLLTCGWRSCLDSLDQRIYDVVVLKTDLNGNEIWRKLIPERSKPVVAVGLNGDLLLAVKSQKPDSTYLNWIDISVYKLDLNGDELESRIYDFGGGEILYDLIPTADSNFLLLASTGKPENTLKRIKRTPDEPDSGKDDEDCACETQFRLRFTLVDDLHLASFGMDGECS
jgi:hypothetical protein